MEQTREELAVERRRSHPAWLASGLRIAAKAAGAVSGSALLVGLVIDVGDFFLVPLVGLAGGVAVFTTIGFVALEQRHRDVDTAFWSRMWMGRIGKLVFALARKLPGGRAVQSAMTHRATELSLGMAAEHLYESLPKETRQALPGLPTVLHRLQDDAQALRSRYDELQDVLADVGDAAASAEYSDLRAARDVVHAKLGDAVGALETIRLNLLRLHAGSATVEGLTTHLGLAAEVSEDVERLIAAHEEVERTLKFPRLEASTPV
jgi:hypothetical protein